MKKLENTKWWKEKIVEVNKCNRKKEHAARKKRLMNQLVNQGWSDIDTWSLDHAIAKLILPRLIRFKEVNNGFPPDLTEKKWDSTLQKMIDAFTIVASDKYWERTKKDQKVITEGLKLFAQYFQDLWW